MRGVNLSEPQKKVQFSRKHLILDMGGQRAGKTHNIGFSSGFLITNFPLVNGFIGANSDQQLSKTTIRNVRAIWKSEFNYEQYDKVKNPYGQYVIDKIPPPHFKVYQEPKSYYNTVSFLNGGFIYLGSLKNYLAHEGLEFGWAHLDEVADTKEEAVKDVILGRLSQAGLYYYTDGSLVYFDGKQLLNDKFKPFKGDVNLLEPFNPCYFHTSPKKGVTPWLIDMFKLSGREDEIKSSIMSNGGLGFYNKVEGNTEAVIYSTFHNEKNLQPNYIENRKSELTDLESVKYIYGYPFAKTGGEFLPSFDRLKHSGSVPYLPEKPVHMSWDFNAVPYNAVTLYQVVVVTRYFDDRIKKYYSALPDGITDLPKKEVLQVRLFSEFALRSPLNSANATCEAFKENFSAFNPEVYLYGDASGKSRVPGHGDGTNFKTIKSLLAKFLNNSSDRVPAANPFVMKSRDFVERILQGKYAIEFIVDRVNCPETIKDLEFVKQGPEGQLKEYFVDTNGVKYEKNGHALSTVRYFLTAYFKDLFQKAV